MSDDRMGPHLPKPKSIVISPAMVQAGIKAMNEALDIEDTSEVQMVTKMFIAMWEQHMRLRFVMQRGKDGQPPQAIIHTGPDWQG